jgi:hypothetical protein
LLLLLVVVEMAGQPQVREWLVQAPGPCAQEQATAGSHAKQQQQRVVRAKLVLGHCLRAESTPS